MKVTQALRLQISERCVDVRHLIVTGKITLADLEDKFTPRNPVYTAVILTQIPGVEYKVKPIRLIWVAMVLQVIGL